MSDSICKNPNTISGWDKLWAKTGYRYPEQVPVDERKRAVASLVPRGSLLLDIACGAGQIREFLDPSIKYIGLDFSAEAFRLNPGRHIRGDVRRLPVKTQSVPVVVAMEILEHLEAPKSFILELMRITQKLVILSVPKNRLTPEDTAWHLHTYDKCSLFDFLDRIAIAKNVLITETKLNLIARLEL